MTFKEENIVNIAMRAAELLKDHKIQPDDISGHAGLTESILHLADEFEQLHEGRDWNAPDAPDYWESIDSFAEDRLLERYGIEREENTVSLWARVGMTLNVPKETYEQLLTGDRAALQAVLDGEVGEARLDGETYFPDLEQNVGLEEMEFDLPVRVSEHPLPAATNEDVYDLMCVLAVSAGGVRKLVYSGTWEECNDFCEENKYSFKDENDFVWDLELEATCELPPHLRPSWGRHRQEEPARPSLADQIQSVQGRKEQSAAPEKPVVQYDMESTLVSYENYKGGVNNLTVCKTNPIGENPYTQTPRTIVTTGTAETKTVLENHKRKLDRINRENLKAAGKDLDR